MSIPFGRVVNLTEILCFYQSVSPFVELNLVLFVVSY